MNRLGRDSGECTNSLVPWQMKIKAFGSKLRGFHPQVNSLMPREFTINSCGDWVAESEKVTNDRAAVFSSDPACSDSMNRPLHIWYRRCTCTRPAKMTLGSFRHVSQEYEITRVGCSWTYHGYLFRASCEHVNLMLMPVHAYILHLEHTNRFLIRRKQANGMERCSTSLCAER